MGLGTRPLLTPVAIAGKDAGADTGGGGGGGGGVATPPFVQNPKYFYFPNGEESHFAHCSAHRTRPGRA